MARGVLVPYDGSRRAEQALERALATCRASRARLAVAIVQQPVIAVGSPWVCTAIVPSERQVRCKLLSRLPSDVSVVFISWPYRPGPRVLAKLANRLECDSVVLTCRGWRARYARRRLAKRGIAVLRREDARLTPGRRELAGPVTT